MRMMILTVQKWNVQLVVLYCTAIILVRITGFIQEKCPLHASFVANAFALPLLLKYILGWSIFYFVSGIVFGDVCYIVR